MAAALRACGLNATCSDVFTSRGFDQTKNVEAEASWNSAPFLKDLGANVMKVHLVRHPLLSISSTFRIFRHWDSHNFGRRMLQFIDVSGNPETFDYHARLWLEWTKIIESGTSLRVRIEEERTQVLQRMGLTPPPGS